jgi:phosphatidylglycerol:prolipoprotein diacylglycerol transferase
VLGAISYHPLVHIKLGPLAISPHGIGIAAGFLVGARLLVPRTRRLGVPDDDVYSMLSRAALGAIIGARLAYVVNHASDFHSVIDILKVWQGGISLLGGFFGAILLTMPAMRARNLSFWKLMDACAPAMALGVVVGRVGDLIVADHLGKTTTFFLGYLCPAASVATASPCVPGTVVHQTALYDLLLTIPLLLALLRLRRRARFDGFLIMVFGAWYGSQRVLEDFLREDVRRFGLTGSQMTALTTVTISLCWLAFARRTPKWGRWDERAAAVDATDAESGDGPGSEPEATSADADPTPADATAATDLTDTDTAADTDPEREPADAGGPDPHKRED